LRNVSRFQSFKVSDKTESAKQFDQEHLETLKL
jgi:hypothetical protein